MSKRKRKALIRIIPKSGNNHCDCGQRLLCNHDYECHFCFEDFIDSVAGSKAVKSRDAQGRLRGAYIVFD